MKWAHAAAGGSSGSARLEESGAPARERGSCAGDRKRAADAQELGAARMRRAGGRQLATWRAAEGEAAWPSRRGEGSSVFRRRQSGKWSGKNVSPPALPTFARSPTDAGREPLPARRMPSEPYSTDLQRALSFVILPACAACHRDPPLVQTSVNPCLSFLPLSSSHVPRRCLRRSLQGHAQHNLPEVPEKGYVTSHPLLPASTDDSYATTAMSARPPPRSAPT